ncbi:MarC family protein [Candidatus Neptunichlamydia sp. REUL1]|uniref:MarC family protein n=1 Tax=Candidatus Neptunichlamydia sp. REUL1 TaxID=3064277 RepID=UPI00292DAAAC|nr:MarC family protein [Candidatus Neptunochlamydia sp. REUL1]
MPQSPVSMAVALFFVINVLGNIPLYLSLLGRYSIQKQRLILLREFGFALVILLLFNYFGSGIFNVLGINEHILGMAGGILLLLISIPMIFPKEDKEKGPQHEPMIVPLATPVIAGPGSITAVMLYSSRVENPLLMTGIICGAMVISCAIALLSSFFKYGLGEKGLVAFERLGGMIVALIAVQMFATGAIELVKTSFFL